MAFCRVTRAAIYGLLLAGLLLPTITWAERSVNVGGPSSGGKASVIVTGEDARLQLNGFPGASLESSSNAAVDDYTLALGTYRKVQGLWRVEQQRLNGYLQRRTYRLPSNHSAREGFDFFAQQLQENSAQALFVCQSRDCGESNTWANNHFKILQLYGLDQYQHYGAYKLTLPGTQGVYVTIYAVLRGNKRVYVQLEVLAQGQKASS
jgi:hypothetical protein